MALRDTAIKLLVELCMQLRNTAIFARPSTAAKESAAHCLALKQNPAWRCVDDEASRVRDRNAILVLGIRRRWALSLLHRLRCTMPPTPQD